MSRREAARYRPAVALLMVLPLLQAFAPALTNQSRSPVRIVTLKIAETDRFEIPQVQLPDLRVAGRINQAIVAKMLTGPAELDSALNQDPMRALHQALAACCTDDQGQRQPAQGLTAAGYQVLHNDGRLLCLEFDLETTGAYSDVAVRHAVFHIATGRQPTLTDLLADSPAQLRQRLRWAINRRIKETLADALEEEGPELVADLAERFNWNTTTSQVRFEDDQQPALDDFIVSDKGIELYYAPWLPPVLRSHAPNATYFLPFERVRLKPGWRYLSPLSQPRQ